MKDIGEKINIVPQPVQKPHPPLWQVVDSPSSIEWAAKNDINIIMWIPPVQSLKKRFEIYQKAKDEKEKRHVELGEGISVVSCVVTESYWIVTYYGDARFLQGLPTSQWEDVNTGFGVSSIYNTGGNVGIATSNPQFTLQVGGDVNSNKDGVGISSAGNIKISGIASASQFSGNLTGNISSDTVVSGIATFSKDIDVDGHTNLDNVSIAGVTTFTGATTHSGGATVNTHLDVIGLTTLDDVNVSSGATFAAPIDLNSDLDVDGHTNLDNVSIAGVSTFTGDAILNGDVRVGTAMTFSSNGIVVGNNKDLKIGSGLTIASNTDGSHVTFFNNTEVQHILEPNVTSEVWTSEIQVGGTTVFVPQFKIHRNTGVELYYENGGRKFATSGVGVTISNQLDTTNIVASGVITATTELNSPLIGVGTDTPANDIQVRKSGNAEIQVTSDTGVAGLTVGRESGTGNTNNAEFRYGGGAGANYSSAQSLDILNYGTGNFNYHLSANNAGAVAGDFHWHKGLNNTRLMTLTGIGGSLGIGITTPTTPLHVLGAATISGNVNLGGDLNVSGNAALNVIGNVTGTLTGNVNSVGVSTFARLDVDSSNYSDFGQISATGVGIGTTMGNKRLVINQADDDQFSVSGSGLVGIKTDEPNGNALLVNGDTCILETVGVGTNVPRAAIDFSDAGQTLTGAAANRMYMIPPKVTSSQRGNLLSLVSGAFVYDTDSNNIQVYNGSAWSALGSGGGGGGGEANQNAFHQIAVAGASAIIADSPTDTITLNAGSGIQYTTNASTDELTISTGGDVVSTDPTPQLGGNLDVQTREIITSTSNGNIKLTPNGTGVVEIKGDGSSADGTLQLNCSQNSHGVKIKSPAHSAGASYTLTLPTNIVDGQFLKTNSSGVLSWDSRSTPGSVNVKDYGAVGDYNVQTSSGTDDRAAIIAAINALGTEGGTVYFPPGNYYVSSQIEINGNSGGSVVSNCLIFEGLSSPADGGYGDAGGAEICVPQNTNYTIFYVNGAEAVYFRNLRFRGGNKFGSGGTGSNSTNHAIKLERRIGGIGGNDHLLENLIFVGMTACIQLYGVGRTTIRKIKIGNCPSASTDIIRVDENQEGASDDRRLDQLRIEGCVIDAAPDNTSDASRNNANGLGIYATSNTIFVKDTSIIRANYNFYLDSASDGEFIYFSNCEAERAQIDGFYINGSEFISIDNCFSCGNNQSGVRIDGNTISSVSMTNCNIRTNQRHGIHLNAGSLQDLSIVNARMGANNVSNGTYHNVFLANGTHNVYIAGGKMGGSTTLSGTGNQKYGIYIDGTSHDHIRIIGANVNGNTDGGIYVNGSWGGTGNKIQFNSGTSVTKNT